MATERLRLSPVQAWGIVRGAELSMRGALIVSERGIALHRDPNASDAAAREIAPGAVDGVLARGATLDVFLSGGDVLEVTASSPSEIDDAASEIERRVCALPEQTLHLRAFGSLRGTPGSDHDRFFAPLLGARRSAERADGVAAQLAAFDAERLAERLDAVLHELAASRHARPGPEQRGLEAELMDAAEQLVASLDALARSAFGVRQAEPDARFARWREWAAAVQRVFAEADRAWEVAVPALGDAPSPRRGFWRRVLRRG